MWNYKALHDLIPPLHHFSGTFLYLFFPLFIYIPAGSLCCSSRNLAPKPSNVLFPPLGILLTHCRPPPAVVWSLFKCNLIRKNFSDHPLKIFPTFIYYSLTSYSA